MADTYRSNILGEAASKLAEVAAFLDIHACPDSMRQVDHLSSLLLSSARTSGEAERTAVGAGLEWMEAQIIGATKFAFGNRYLGWVPAKDMELPPGWRLPTPEELRHLYEEKPGSIVFDLNGRHVSGQACGVGTTAAIWTSQDDSRDFAIEATVTQEFGLTAHPALKTNCNTVWYVKEL